MSEAVIGFQLAIIISILVATAHSEEARATVIGLWVLETFIFVWFLSPLMFLQLGTIAIMYFITDEFYREAILETIKEILIKIFTFILGPGLLIALGLFVYNKFIKDDTPGSSLLTSHQVEKAAQTMSARAQTKQTYSFTIRTTPLVARVRIMNIKPKYRDRMQLAEGLYDVLVDAPGYHSWRAPIQHKGQATDILVTLRRK